MFLYLLVIVLCFVMHNNYNKKHKTDNWTTFFLIYIALFLCGGYMCGSDWRSYETFYNSVSWGNPLPKEFMEPGLFVLMYPFRMAGFGYWIFSIIMKLACFVVFYKFISFYSGRYRFVALAFFISFYGIYLLVDAPMRNLSAIAICLVAYSRINKSKAQMISLLLLAVLFHRTAYVMIFLYLIINKKISSFVFVVAYFILIFISLSASEYIEMFVNSSLGEILSDISSQYETYYVYGYNPASLGASPLAPGEFLKLILFLWLIYNRKTIETIKNGNFLFNGAMCFFLVAKFGAMSNLLMRFGCFLSPFYAIALAIVAGGVSLKLRQYYIMVVFCISFLLCSTAVTADYRYIPYTNYITYLIVNKKEPSFYERSIYNKLNSPYSDKNRR